MNKLNPPIQFHFSSLCSLNDRQRLKVFILSMFKKEKRPFEKMNIIFCDDKYLLTLNREFLKHDFYTDILSFPLSEKGAPLIAELYISVDRVRDNARNLETTFREELHRVIFHGILHFCGYQDKRPLEIEHMRALEDKYLKSYFGIKAKGKTQLSR